MNLFRGVARASTTLLLLAVIHSADAEVPEWIANPKSADSFFDYAVGRGRASGKSFARERAFDNAMDKFGESITDRSRAFNFSHAKAMEGCEYYKRGLFGFECWIQVSLPLVEKQKIQRQISKGKDLNRRWAVADSLLAQDQTTDARQLLISIQTNYHGGLYQDFTLADLNLRIGDSYRDGGDDSLAHDMYSIVLRSPLSTTDEQGAATERLSTIQAPPRFWPIRGLLNNARTDILCVVNTTNGIEISQELIDVLSKDFEEARLEYSFLSPDTNVLDRLTHHVFEDFNYDQVSIILHLQSKTRFVMALRLDVRPSVGDDAYDTSVRLVLYDVTKKELLHNIAFEDHLGKSNLSDLCDHAVGVAIFNYLCPGKQRRPKCAVSTFQPKAGVEPGLAEVMSKAFASELAEKSIFVLVDEQHLALDTPVTHDRQNPENYFEYGKEGQAYRIVGGVGKVGETLHLSTKQIDVESGKEARGVQTSFTRFDGALLAYEMEKNVCTLFDLPIPRRPLGTYFKPRDRTADDVVSVYTGLPEDMQARGRIEEIKYREYTTGALPALGFQEDFAMDNSLPIEAWSKRSEIPFRLIPPGDFFFGNKRVETSVPYGMYVSKTEVTQKQWNYIMLTERSPAGFEGEDRPVESITTREAATFCKRLCDREKVSEGTYRLLTAIEWEYVCRAGTVSPYYTGSDETALKKIAWFRGNTRQNSTMRVGNRTPNSWGLYDMLGNVWEFIYMDTPKSGAIYPCGGSWDSSPEECKVGFQPDTFPSRSNTIGLRIVRTLNPGE